MSLPDTFLHVEWHEGFRDRDQERNFRTARRAAWQVAAIQAAPDDVARLKGVWATNGWKDSRLGWEPVDVDELLAGVAADEADDEDIGVLEHMRRISDAWRTHQAVSDAQPTTGG